MSRGGEGKERKKELKESSFIQLHHILMEERPLVRVKYDDSGSSFMTSNEEEEEEEEEYEFLNNDKHFFYETATTTTTSTTSSMKDNEPHAREDDITPSRLAINSINSTTDSPITSTSLNTSTVTRSFRGEVTPDDSLGDFITSTQRGQRSRIIEDGDSSSDDVEGELLEDDTDDKKKKRKRKRAGSTLYLWLSGLIICLSAFNFGYNTTALNLPTQPNSEAPILFHLSSNDVPEPGLTKTQIELATSTITFGALVGVFLVSYPNEQYGRKVALALNNVFFICGSLLCSSAVSFSMLVAGRFLTGIGTGAAAMVVPQLLAEISPPLVRGSFTALNTLSISIGTLSSALVFFSMPAFSNPTVGWRLTLGY